MDIQAPIPKIEESSVYFSFFEYKETAKYDWVTRLF